mmetsp:Transcript_2912/g.18278  ORF Transcript_2912/g.18278 Transcript_2912/m.18278 type:complete len:213 (+) Transcript_2912:990-1628(+)
MVCPCLNYEQTSDPRYGEPVHCRAQALLPGNHTSPCHRIHALFPEILHVVRGVLGGCSTMSQCQRLRYRDLVPVQLTVRLATRQGDNIATRVDIQQAALIVQYGESADPCLEQELQGFCQRRVQLQGQYLPLLGKLPRRICRSFSGHGPSTHGKPVQWLGEERKRCRRRTKVSIETGQYPAQRGQVEKQLPFRLAVRLPTKQWHQSHPCLHK